MTDVPVSERPREKLLNRGAETLTDAELLAIFVRTGVPGRNAVEIAHDIIAEFGGLVELLQASKANFCNTRGLGPAKYAQLSAVLEIAKRYQFNKAETGAFLESPDAVKSLVALEMRDLEHEIFACLFLDNRHRLISCLLYTSPSPRDS